MITLVIVKNPFSPQDGRDVLNIEYNGTIGDLIEEHQMPGVDLNATVNGYTVDEDYQIKDDDFVVIYPSVEKGDKGGKGILSIVAALALSFVSFGISNLGWLGATKGIFAAGAWGAYAVATAVMFIGSALISRMSGSGVDTGSYGDDNDPTYSWGGVQTMEGQNNSVSLTYGKVKSGGQTIGKFVSSEENDEYLNWLVSAGEGELTITEITLNDNPITNYDNVTYEVRNGTNDQEVVPYFNDTYFTKNLAYHMTTVDQWYTDTAQGNATEGLIFKIEFPQGLFHGKDDGKLANNYVDIELQYKLHSAENWTDYDTVRITGKSTKAIRKEYRIDNLTAGAYDVRAKVVEIQYSNATRDNSECYWNGITSIVYDDFIYPCNALIGIRAKATDQLSGSPSLTFMKERTSVWVWNPYTNQYVEKAANNPAWACYDVLHQARKLKNINNNTYEFEVRGCAKELLRYDDFYEWAEFCDDKEYYVNIEINTVGELLEICNQKIAPIGHGLVVRFGTKYGCIYSHVQTPVQMFGMGNIIEGTFNEEFLNVSDRANCVEITFTNKDAGYEREVITIYGDTYDTDGYAKAAQMTFDGITDYEQAYREGMYQLYSNKYLLRTVTFTAGIDAIACTVGDVIMVSHDVPQWANSGRIEKIENGVWTLPVQVNDLTQSYRIQWRTVKDNMYTRACTILTSANGWTTLTTSGDEIPSADQPQAGDVFDLAIANIGSKPFVVKAITRSQDFERTITCLEYNEAIFSEQYDIPVINYSQWYGSPQNVTGLVANLSQVTDDFGNKIGKIRCSWNMPDNGGKFTVLLSTDGTNWTVGKSNVAGNSCELDVLPNTTYWVKVVTLLGVNQSSGVTAGPLYPTGDGALPNASNLTGNTIYRGVKNGEVRYEIHLVWQAPLLSNYRCCDVWYKSNNAMVSNLSMASGVAVSQMGYENDWKYAGSGYSDFTLSDVTTGDVYKFAVVTRDALGNSNVIESSPQVTVTASARTETPNTPNGFRLTFGKEIKAKWNEVSNTDIDFYEVRNNTYEGVEDEHLLARTSGTLTGLTLTSRTGTLYLYAKSVLGKYSAPAVLQYAKELPPKPDKPTVSANLGSINIVASAIPDGCLGMRVYIDGNGQIVSATTENNTYTHSCEAGIYDVSVAYLDIFGEGQHSTAARIVIKKTIDAKLLEDEAVNIAKVDSTIQAALEDATNSARELIDVRADMVGIENDLATVIAQGEGTHTLIEQTDGKIAEMITNLNKGPGNTTYASITQLTRDLEGLSSLVETIRVNGEGDTSQIEVLSSQIQQTAASLQSTVSMLNSSPTAEGQYSAITQLKQTADGITTTVANNKATEQSHYSGLTSRIDQQASQITTIVGNLDDFDDATANYSAIAQLQDNIELRVAKNGVISSINLTPETARIKGKLITLDGDTRVTGYFWANAVEANSITADKLDVNKLSSITADVGSLTGGTITGTTLVGSTIKNANNTFSVSANGAIKGATLTTATINSGTINADIITSAGFQVKASNIRTGTVSGNNGTIPLPSGYTEAQCLWVAYPPSYPSTHPNNASYLYGGSHFSINGRVVTAYADYDLSGDEQGGNTMRYYPSVQYRCIGIK